MRIPDPDVCAFCGRPFTARDAVQPYTGLWEGVRATVNAHVECAAAQLVPGPDVRDIGVRLPEPLIGEIDRRAVPTKGGKGRSVVVERVLERHFKMVREQLPVLRGFFPPRDRRVIAEVCLGVEPKGERFLSDEAAAICQRQGLTDGYNVVLARLIDDLNTAQRYALWDALERLATLQRPQFDTLLDDPEDVSKDRAMEALGELLEGGDAAKGHKDGR